MSIQGDAHLKGRRMRLIKDEILALAVKAGSAGFKHFSQYGVTASNILSPDAMLLVPEDERGSLADLVDIIVNAHICSSAQTVLFSTEQITEFLRVVDRPIVPGSYDIPFRYMVIQFTEAIPQSEFLVDPGPPSPGEISPKEAARILGVDTIHKIDEETDDVVAGLVIGFPDEGELESNRAFSVSAYYGSTAHNRAIAYMNKRGEVHYDPSTGGTETGRMDKQRIVNLAQLCIVYMNSSGMELERTSHHDINRKRRRKGKRELPDYYICKWNKNRYAPSEGRRNTGRHVSFRFDVAGHTRTLSNGKTVWVSSHQRGLQHEIYKPKIVKVD